jgi:phosphatidylserine/phosphatidylglycerophosphate/cardiolipin synthase-like enzyme
MPAANHKTSRSRATRSKSRAGRPRLDLLALLLVAGLFLYLLVFENPLGWFSAQPTPAAQVALAGTDTPAPLDLPGLSTSPTPFIPLTDTPPPTQPAATLQPAATQVPATQPLLTQQVATLQPAATIHPAGSGRSSWWEIYFSDPNRINDPQNLAGSLTERLIGYINQAERSIHIAAFEFDLTPVAEALIAAHRRGVEVQWITDDEHGLGADQDEGHGQFAMLQAAGIPIISDNRHALMHNKFIIFDRATVWTGSTNITVNDHFRNNNNVIVIRSPALAAVYETQFATMWAGEFGQRSPSDVDAQSLIVLRTPVQVLFSPEDNAIPFLIPYLQRAQESIRFMAFSYTHDGLTEAMLERARAGVDVRGIFETRGSQTPYSALAPLFCARLPVRQDGNPRTFHHKVIVIDERIIVTGSLNFSDNANEPNNENTLIITSRTMASRYLQEFERRWQEARDPDPAALACP